MATAGTIRGLVFDLDGLILDTEVPALATWQEIYQERGGCLELAAWAAGIGAGHDNDAFDPCAYLSKQIGRPIDSAALLAEYRRRYLATLSALPALPGVESYLTDARRLGVRTAIASSSPREWVFGHAGRLGLLPWFDAVICAEDAPRSKPDPDLYLAVVARLGLAPAEAIAFEDSPNGLLAAKRAGLYCVAVPNAVTRQLPLDSADRRLDSLADLPLSALLAEVNSALVER